MKNSVIFIVGTSREDGNTWKLLNHINKKIDCEIVNLSKLNISYFDYEHKNIDDDFISTIEKILNYKTIGFISPVYWYSVSAQMKTFIDRTSDLLTVRKDLGRKLKGKNSFLMATGSTDLEIPLGMIEVIELTSNYFEMNYHGSFYAKMNKELEFTDKTLNSAFTFVNKF